MKQCRKYAGFEELQKWAAQANPRGRFRQPDPDAKLARKGSGKEPRLSYNCNVLVQNRNGLVADV
jgi:hypothetical protein